MGIDLEVVACFPVRLLGHPVGMQVFVSPDSRWWRFAYHRLPSLMGSIVFELTISSFDVIGVYLDDVGIVRESRKPATILESWGIMGAFATAPDSPKSFDEQAGNEKTPRVNRGV